MATYNDSGIQYSSSTTTYNGVATVSGSGSASLGRLIASAVGVVPSPQFPGAGNPWWVKQQPVTKKIVERQSLTLYGSASALLNFDAYAFGEITWSILDDEADLLLLI
jgi:hypothetical protein